MRTLIDIPQDDLNLLNRLSRSANKSRAELVRQAISSYLKPYRRTRRVEGFGLWSERPVDGAAYQEKVRQEWDA